MSRESSALVRWRLGHHAFHLHLVVINTVLSRASRSCTRRRWTDLATDLERLRVLFDGASATMHFAADFDTDDYHRVVRPSMEPPFLSPGFSASFGQEHVVMLRRTRRLHRLLRAAEATEGILPGDVPTACRRLRQAEARIRREHHLICRRLVPEGGSLLRTARAARETPE